MDNKLEGTALYKADLILLTPQALEIVHGVLK